MKRRWLKGAAANDDGGRLLAIWKAIYAWRGTLERPEGERVYGIQKRAWKTACEACAALGVVPPTYGTIHQWFCYRAVPESLVTAVVTTDLMMPPADRTLAEEPTMTVFPGRTRSIRTAPLNVRVTPAIRRRLEKAREESGLSLGDEVEARLRDAFDVKSGNGRLLLLHLDDGLLAHLEAHHDAMGRIHGDLEDFVLFRLREWLIQEATTPFTLQEVVPRLREPYRTTATNMPAYRAAEAAEGRRIGQKR